MTQKKIIVGILVGISIISLLSAISDSPTIPARNTVDIPEATALAQEMPPSSNSTYGTDEYVIINDIVAKGMVLKQYQRTFTNRNHYDYNIMDIYADFDKDMEQFAMYLRQDLMQLRALRPARESAMQSQSDVLYRAEGLYFTVSKYKQHEYGIKDTLEFLAACNYELERVGQQAKMLQP